MNRFGILLLFAIFAGPICYSYEDNDLDDEFWQNVAKFDLVLYNSKSESSKILNRLEHLAKELDYELVRVTMFISKLNFIELYSDTNALVAHFDKDFSNVPKKHLFYLRYIYTLSLSLIELGNFEKLSELKNELKKSELDMSRLYLSLIELREKSTSSNFESVMSYCEEGCLFNEHSLTMLDYYYKQGNTAGLRKLAMSLFDKVLIKEYAFIPPSSVKMFMGYAGYAYRKENKVEAADDLFELSIEGLSTESNLYDRLYELSSTSGHP